MGMINNRKGNGLVLGETAVEETIKIAVRTMI